MQATERIKAQPVVEYRQSFGRRMLSVPEIGAGVGIVVFLGIFALFDKTMLYPSTLARMLITAAPMGFAGIGMMYLMLAGEIDIASGGTAGLAAGAVSAYLCAALGWPQWQGLLAGLLVAVAIGLLNAYTTVKLGMPSFFATLITGFLTLGLTVAIMHGHFWVLKNSMPLENWLRRDSFVPGLPWTVIIFLTTVLIGDLLVRFTKVGAILSATGGNRRAAEASGINTGRVKTLCFVLTAVCAWVGGLLVISAGLTADGSVGLEWNLWVIAAAIIGGCSLAGGIGSMAGLLLGMLFIQVMKNGLGAIHMQNNAASLVVGALLIAAAALDIARRKTQQY
jgi:ribose/xylose/arabinose/galactoside ABC-type transport system permease subunit